MNGLTGLRNSWWQSSHPINVSGHCGVNVFHLATGNLTSLQSVSPSIINSAGQAVTFTWASGTKQLCPIDRQTVLSRAEIMSARTDIFIVLVSVYVQRPIRLTKSLIYTWRRISETRWISSCVIINKQATLVALDWGALSTVDNKWLAIVLELASSKYINLWTAIFGQGDQGLFDYSKM